jgi:putative membrane protein
VRESRYLGTILLAIGLVALVVSGIAPYSRSTWVMEVFPIFLVVPLLLLTASRFPLTPMLYLLILVHAVILMVGGHWTYARVPIGDWVEQLLGLTRNPYDRLGHFAQGFIPAIAAREILRRKARLADDGWLFFIVCAVCLAISACYEFIEWWTAVAMGSGATDFLGTQGDPWDTQWDMFTALIGSVVAQLTLRRWHERQLVAGGLIAPR